MTKLKWQDLKHDQKKVLETICTLPGRIVRSQTSKQFVFYHAYSLTSSNMSRGKFQVTRTANQLRELGLVQEDSSSGVFTPTEQGVELYGQKQKRMEVTVRYE